MGKSKLVLFGVIVLVIMTSCAMVKYTAVEAENELKAEGYKASMGSYIQGGRAMGLVAMQSDDALTRMSQRFPYLAAITRNSSETWTMACFGSLIVAKWVVTSAHCRIEGSEYRVFLLADLAHKNTNTHAVTHWKLHDLYRTPDSGVRYDIALLKLFTPFPGIYDIRPGLFDDVKFDVSSFVDASIWKSIATMNMELILTNEVAEFQLQVVDSAQCTTSFGYVMDDSVMCVDMSRYGDCFMHEFGPLFSGDKVVGVLAAMPRDCDGKLSIFTNVSHYATWILKATQWE